MLKTIADNRILFVVMGLLAAIGLVSKMITWFSLKRMAKAAGNMNLSSHRLMKLLKAKFEHACMVSDKVQNVKAFIEKYLYEYRILGLKIHTWQQLEKQSAWLLGLTAAVGAMLSYYEYGMRDEVFYYAGIGGAAVVLLIVFYISADERYLLDTAQVYMTDYLENVYAHRMEKMSLREREKEEAAVRKMETNGKEEVSTEETAVDEKTEEDPSEHVGLAIEIKEKNGKTEENTEGVSEKEIVNISDRLEKQKEEASREQAIREILEEFLAQN